MAERIITYMMKTNIAGQIICTLILISIAVFMLNPFGWLLPNIIEMVLAAFALISFGLLTSFIMREEVGDEKQIMHRMHAGRTAFLVGAGFLIVALIFETWAQAVDPWIVIALVAMVLTKIAVRVYSDFNL